MLFAAVYVIICSLAAVGLCLTTPVNLTARAQPLNVQLISRDFTHQPQLTDKKQRPNPLFSYSGIFSIDEGHKGQQIPDDILASLAAKAHIQMRQSYRTSVSRSEVGTDSKFPGTVAVMQLGDFIYFASSVTGSGLNQASLRLTGELATKGSNLKHGGTHAEPNCVRLWQQKNDERPWPETPQPRSVAYGVTGNNVKTTARYFPPCADGGDSTGCKSFLNSLKPKIHSPGSTCAAPADVANALKWLGPKLANPRNEAADDDECNDQPGTSGHKGPKRRSSDGKTPAIEARADRSASKSGASGSETKGKSEEKEGKACKAKSPKDKSKTADSKTDKKSSDKKESHTGKSKDGKSEKKSKDGKDKKKSHTGKTNGESEKKPKGGKKTSSSRKTKKPSSSKKPKKTKASKKTG